MLELLGDMANLFGPFRLFHYITFRTLGAMGTALLFCLFFGPFIIRKLTELKLGQPIRTKDEVHRLAELHGGKRGTPTMGGVMIIAAVGIASLLWADIASAYVWLALFSMVVLGGLGFYDDFLKVRKKKSDGISGRMKLLVQLFVAVFVGVVLLSNPATFQQASQLELPFFKSLVLHMGWFALIFYALVIMGSSNAVNLTDGLDGLAAGCTVIVAGVFTAFSYISGNIKMATYLQLPYSPGVGELSVFMGALVGASLGFLWYNCHPAKVFMGDTGSLAIGGALGVVAICINQELLLVVVGGVFVMEALSVILQVGSFKLTGKRIFAMAPIHHHFELKGWSETAVVVRFWILGIFFAAMAMLTLKLR